MSEETVERMTITIIRTTIIEECPICGENMVFEKIERFKNGERTSEKLIKKTKLHTVSRCIDKLLHERKLADGWGDNAEICENCRYFVNEADPCMCSDSYRCTHPDHTFESTDEIAAFQRKNDEMEYPMLPRTYEPAKIIHAWTEPSATCKKFERGSWFDDHRTKTS